MSQPWIDISYRNLGRTIFDLRDRDPDVIKTRNRKYICDAVAAILKN